MTKAILSTLVFSVSAFAGWTFPTNGTEYAHGGSTQENSKSVMKSIDRDTLVARQKWAATKQPRPSDSVKPEPSIISPTSENEGELRKQIYTLEAQVQNLEGQLSSESQVAFREFRFFAEQKYARETDQSADYQKRINLLQDMISYANEVKYYPNPNNMAYNAMKRLNVSYENLPKYFQDLGREYFIEAGYVSQGSKSCRVASAGRPKRK